MIIITIIIIIIIIILHNRNRHLRSDRGLSVACSHGCPVAFSNTISMFSGIFQRIATCPVDCYWNCPMDFSGAFSDGCSLCVRSGV